MNDSGNIKGIVYYREFIRKMSFLTLVNIYERNEHTVTDDYESISVSE
jgi:hypothetical protein